MSAQTGKPVQEVVKQASTLAGIQEKLQQLSRLNQLWRQTVPDALAQNSCVANWRERCLVIELQSSAWATRLQYAIPELLESLRRHAEFKQLLAIDWYINPSSPAPVSSSPKAPLLSGHNARLLDETAQHLTNNALKSALQKLAAHRNKN